MSILYRFLLRCTALMVLMMACLMPARAQQLPFTVTTNEEDPVLYWIESHGAKGFYAIPHTDNTLVSTTNMPNLKALWYFMDASDGYYYIVNYKTGKYLKHEGTFNEENTIKLASLSGDVEPFKFSVVASGMVWVIYPKSAGTSYWVNKKNSNVHYEKYLKSSNYNNSPDDDSKWSFVPKDDVAWAHPFDNSTNEEKHYFIIHNATSNGSAFYMSTDDASDPYATVSNVDNSKRVWYFMEADSNDTIPNLKYYYIVNAKTGKYLKFTKTANGNSQASSLQLYEHDGTETGEAENRFQFMVLNAKGKNYSAYSIMPKLEINYYDNKNASLSPSSSYNNSLSNDMKIGIYNDRGQDNNYAHWTIEPTDFVLVEAPTITNNFDGTISLSTTTPGLTIHYTTNGGTPNNTCTVYSSPFSLGKATVIKAIAYQGSSHSDVSIYNVPKYTKPIISFDNSSSEITITCAGATGIYYTTDGSIPTTSSTPYNDPFTISSNDTIKAIATHTGYLNSDVATWPIPPTQKYLTFDVITSGTILWKNVGNVAKTISYSKNNGIDWTEITATTAGTEINVTAGDKVLFKGTNQSYAVDKSNYSGFDGGTATYDISGNIMSLIYGDNFIGQTELTGTYNFCSIFKQSKAVSAENLILPATTLTNYCYRAMFSKAHDMAVAPALPATTLAQGCYWYMFEECPISTAPDLNATTLVNECYGYMFTGCTSLNYIKCLATTITASKCLEGWVTNVSSTGTFVKFENTTWPTGANGIPNNWTVEGIPDVPTISCDGREIELSCTTTGAEIYYKLNHGESYTQYTTVITMEGDTFIECYSEKDGKTSAIISQTCEYDDRTLYEYSNQSLDIWTYNGNTITTPYSVNAIDGHGQSSDFAKGTFNFETDVNLRSAQPTYLWFQHADQSAVIYVDGTEVVKHWGGYNAFFVDISNYVHKGTNRIKVTLKNNEGNNLAPAEGDFNFNATLGKVKLFTSPCLPSMSYGYDGFHITSTVSSGSATINVKTTVPEAEGTSVTCIIMDGNTLVYTETQDSTEEEMVFTTTITNPHLWNGTIDPHLYNVKLEIYHNNVLYHSYERPYGFRFYEYVINDTNKVGTAQSPYTGFLLNGQPYLLRGCCMHDDIAGKANALNDADYLQTFAIIKELGNNFLRLAHYPHPKEVYDWCDSLGIVVQTEVPCVNKLQTTMPEAYWTHLVGQYDDMVNQHYNHPCIMFWGLSNEAKVTDSDEGRAFAKTKIEAYTAQIKALDSERMVGLVGHSLTDPLSYFGGPTNIDWIGSNLYVGWYDGNSNNPTNKLNTCISNTITSAGKAYAFSEYGGGGTQRCHSETPSSTTNKGSGGARHDIEYQMWLHEGHIAAIKNKPELLFSSEWQLFDIAVTSRNEGYTVCLDGETVFENNELRYLNDKGLVERDHVTKKDTYYLYKAWWNQTDKFVHICGKDYLKTENRVIKCYTNDGNSLKLYVNGVDTETITVTDNIATFTARNFSDGDVIKVSGATSEDTFTIHSYGDNVFIKEGDWNTASNWSSSAVPADGSDVVIAAKATIPTNAVVDVDEISVISGATLTVKDGAQLIHSNEGVTATVQKDIAAYTVQQTQGETKTNGWYFIASPIKANLAPGEVTNMITDQIAPPYSYDLYRFNQAADDEWENYLQHNTQADPFVLVNGAGYLYANNSQVTLQFTGELKPYSTSANTVTLAQTGWNLIGNPFTCNVYADHSFYKMNEARTGLTAELPVSTVIAPCEGIFVNDAEGEKVTFTKDAPTPNQSINANLQIALRQPVTDRREGNASGMIDNAIVSFNEGFLLPKFYFGHQNANIYIPQNGKDYAIAFADSKVGEIPLNFKAHENGEYTLSFSRTLNSSLLTLHLIDNLTGANIDLLQTPEYTFNARTSDYASRFRLVFAAKDDPSDDHDDFAFISNGEIIVLGEGTLQVFDVLGRQLFVKQLSTLNSQLSIPTSPGVYVLRLMDGEKVRVQKIVVE